MNGWHRDPFVDGELFPTPVAAVLDSSDVPSRPSLSGVVVSIRSVAEGELLLATAAAGASCLFSVMDVKEPLRGSLGMVDPQVARHIAALAKQSGRRSDFKISLAMGELSEMLAARGQSRLLAERYPLAEYDWVKAGPAGTSCLRDWQLQWSAWQQSVPESTAAVIVAYADADRANAPAVDQLVAAAGDLPTVGVLIDTYDKSSGNLFTCLDVGRLAEFREQLACENKWLAVAGQLALADQVHWENVGPRYIAFRGAVCGGDRSSTLCPQRLASVLLLAGRPIRNSPGPVADNPSKFAFQQP